MREPLVLDPKVHQCHDCSSPIPRQSWSCRKKQYECDNCQVILCQKCEGMHPLLKDLDADIETLCKDCFHSRSVLDFSRTFDTVVGPSDVVFVYCHGGGATRALFAPHAEVLRTKYGHSSILFDLPGHGSLVETPLNLESCRETLISVLERNKDLVENKTVVYVGGSLGGYIGFYLIDALKDDFSGAILLDCGQNVGPDASQKARMGLWFLKHLGSRSSNKELMNMMVKVTKKSKADYKLIESTFGAGVFFDQVEAQVECLKSVAPAQHIPNILFPILFMNGGEDYRDSEYKWLSLCTNQLKSDLKVYRGGDHFFTHDSRFTNDILQRFDDFVKALY